MEISNEKLFAYLDGKTTSAESREIMEAAARIPEIARRLERLRRVNAAASGADKPQGNHPARGSVRPELRPDRVAGAGRNAGLPPRRRVNAADWSVLLLASIATLAGFGFGALTVSYLSESSQRVDSDHLTGVFASPGPMFAILETQGSGRAAALSRHDAISVLPVLTFRTAAGIYCREYMVTSRQALTRGLACRENGDWNIKALAALPRRGTASPDLYTTASGGSLALFDDFANQLKAGDAFSVEAEQELIANGWK